MTKVVHKMYPVWDLDREEVWLNNMADEGYILSRPGKFRYEFEKCEPGKYKVKVLFLKGMSFSEKNEEYFRFLSEMGIELIGCVHVAGFCCAYFRFESSGDPAELEFHSDLDSKISYHRRIFWYCVFATPLLVFGAMINTSSCLRGHTSLRFINGIVAGWAWALAAAGLVAIFGMGYKILKLKKERRIHE